MYFSKKWSNHSINYNNKWSIERFKGINTNTTTTIACGEKLPGKQWEFIVYDKLDRVTATGPALSPFSDTAVGAVGWLNYQVRCL
jgi:hypothetical protein